MLCVSTIKNQLTKVLYPFVEGLSDIHGHNSAILDITLRSTSETSAAHRKRIGDIFHALSSAFPPIDALVRRSSRHDRGDVTLSDAITVETVYLAIGPFFVVETTPTGKDKNNLVYTALGGATAVRGLRLSALSLIRSVGFA
jgi:cohesin loading factor subunit SCC2